jgi:uracil-DNA glycosylase
MKLTKHNFEQMARGHLTRPSPIRRPKTAANTRFAALVKRIRADQPRSYRVPAFDPLNGNETAKFLFLFEAPGRRACTSGKISFENQDPTAWNFRRQLRRAGITRDEIAVWNTVPWYIGKKNTSAIRAAKGTDVQPAIKYLQPLIKAMPNLRCIVLVGRAARQAHVFLSQITTARIVSCHHTSARAQNSNPHANRDNIKVFRFIKRTASEPVKLLNAYAIRHR